MRFTLMIKSFDKVEHTVIPKDMLETLENALKSYGFEISSVIPESLIGKKLRSILNSMEERNDRSKKIQADVKQITSKS